MTIIVSVMGRKGGITKTTLAKNIADETSRQGYSTALVDADSQGNASDGLSVPSVDAFRALILGEIEWNEALVEVPAKFTGGQRDNLWAVPSYDGQVDIETRQDTPDLIYNCFQDVRGYVDVVVCDCSPALTNVHTGLFFASDFILLPFTCDYDSVMAVERTLNYLNGKAAEQSQYPAGQVLGIVPNKLEAREKVQQTNSRWIIKSYPELHVFQPIRDLGVWRRASQLKVSIHTMMQSKYYQERVDAQAAYNEFLPVANAVIEAMKGGKV